MATRKTKDAPAETGPHAYNYAWEKMFIALTCLTEGTGSIQERVLDAVMGAHTVLGESKLAHDFPPEARPHVRAIYRAMTSTRAQGSEGTFAASARTMSDAEAVEVARLIRQVYFCVQHASGVHEWIGQEIEELGTD